MDQRIYTFDFILKFIEQNKQHCRKLELINLDISLVQSRLMVQMFDNLSVFQNLKVIHFEKTNINE